MMRRERSKPKPMIGRGYMWMIIETVGESRRDDHIEVG